MSFHSMKIRGNTVTPYTGEDDRYVNFYTAFPCDYDLGKGLRLLSIDLEWFLNYDNSVNVCLGLSDINRRDYVYRAFSRSGGGTLYHGEDGCGFAHTYSHKPWDETGFGSNTFTLPMCDGTTKTIKGPWDDGLMIMEHYNDKPYFDVTKFDAARPQAMRYGGAWCVPPLSEIVVSHIREQGITVDVSSPGRLIIEKSQYRKFLGDIPDFPTQWSRNREGK